MKPTLFCCSLLIATGCTEASLKTVNAEPTALIVSHADGDEPMANEEAVLFGSVSDTNHPPEDLLTVWRVDGEIACEDVVPEADGHTACITALTPGDRTVVLSVRDPKNATGADSVTLSVQEPIPNSPPEVDLIDPFEGERYWTDEPIEFRGRALDEEDTFSELVVSVESDIQGAIELDTALDSEGRFSDFADLDSGVHLLTVTVIDSAGDSGKDQALIEVLPANEAPAIAAVTVLPNPATVNDTLTCTYSGFSDSDGDADSSRFEWTVNGVDTPGDAATLSGAFSAGDSVRCTVTPNDGTVDGEPRFDETSVINSPPRIATASILPDPAVAGDSLSCAYEGFEDDDGDADASTIEWVVNGIDTGTGSELDSPVVGGDSVECRVTPHDSIDAGDPIATTLVVGNTAPSVVTIAIVPATGVTASSVLTCTASATDADGTVPSIAYAWDIEGFSVGEGTGLDLGPAAAVSGEVVSCTATASDDDGGTGSATASVVVGNTAPEITGVDLSPNPARTDDTLTATTAASDADGDTVTLTHRWWVNGIEVGETGPALSGADRFDKHDTVHAEVTPFDGIDYGEPLSSGPLDISNSPPSEPTARIDAETGSCHSMDFDGIDDSVTIGPLGIGAEWTFEGWIQWDPSEPGTLFWNECFAIGAFSTRTAFYLLQDDECDGNFGHYLDGEIDASPLTDGEWHHLAVTHDGTFEAFIDGVSMGRSTPLYDTHFSGPYPGGLAAQTGHSYGDVRAHQIRISESVRYASDFTPPTRLSADASTAMFWELGNPDVTTIIDESGSGRHGTVSGGSWVEDCPPGGATEALVCSVETPASDADDDAIEYRAAWTVDGTPFVATSTRVWPGDSVPGDAIGYDETWTCELTPNDGETDGSSATATWTSGAEPPAEPPPAEDPDESGLDGVIDPTIEVDHAAIFASLAITPDGERVYATRTFSDDIIAVSATDLSLIAAINVGGDPTDVDLSPDGTRAYVAVNTSPGRTVVVDTDPSSSTYHSVLHTITLSGNGSLGLGVHPDGDEVIALSQRPDPGTIHGISTDTHAIARTVTPSGAGTSPILHDVAFSADGTRGYASIFQSAGSNNVVTFSLDSFAITGSIDLTLPSAGGGPGNATVTNGMAGPRLWVTNNSWDDDGLTVVDMTTDTVIRHEELATFSGNMPGICATPNGETVLLAHQGIPIQFYDSETIEVFDEHAERTDHCSCVVAPDAGAFFIGTNSGIIIRVDMDRILDADDGPEPIDPETAEETYGDATSESGLVYSASECLFCPGEDWYAAHKAFDDNTGTSASGWYTPWTGSPQWVQVDFGEGNEKTIRHYGLMGATFSAAYSARSWQVVASHNGTDWDTMHEVFDGSLAYVMWGGEPFSRFSFSNETAYRFWRVRVTANMGGVEMGIVEIELMENL